MADPLPKAVVALRPPKSPGAGERILKAVSQMSRRKSAVRREIENRQSKQELMKKGIYKPEPVFGNFLDNLPLDEKLGIPVFVKVIIEKVEAKIDTVGLYRVNGDNAAMQKLRYVHQLAFLKQDYGHFSPSARQGTNLGPQFVLRTLSKETDLPIA